MEARFRNWNRAEYPRNRADPVGEQEIRTTRVQAPEMVSAAGVCERTRPEQINRQPPSGLPAEWSDVSALVRGHGWIENGSHWELDVVFREDDSRTRSGHAAAREHRAKLRGECQRVVTARPAIDYEAAKASITIGAVLKLLGIGVTKTQHRGSCPLHGSTHGTSRCFSASREKNVFNCFKRGQSGNALELWAKATNQTPYDAAIDLRTRLGIELPTINLKTGTGKRNP